MMEKVHVPACAGNRTSVVELVPDTALTRVLPAVTINFDALLQSVR
jgi:hypothetical protein